MARLTFLLPPKDAPAGDHDEGSRVWADVRERLDHVAEFSKKLVQGKIPLGGPDPTKTRRAIKRSLRSHIDYMRGLLDRASDAAGDDDED